MINKKELKQIRVSSKSPVPQLAGSIIKSVEDGFDIEIRAVGASAVNQMYKSIAVARGTLAVKGKDLLIRPGFSTSEGEKEDSKTVMVAYIVIN